MPLDGQSSFILESLLEILDSLLVYYLCALLSGLYYSQIERAHV